ncbi:flagellar export chaperone FlgN [Roseovarius aestuarii]|nr:flagellar export chaperone FlgN [Roseovarius aestuarii]
MTNNNPQTLINRLDSLLEDERRALLDGDLQTIAGLLERKDALIDALNAAEPEVDTDMAALKGKVDRNQALLDGALQGIRKVAGRMAAWRKIRRTLETYDETGRKKSITGEVDHQIEKRA